MWWKVLCVRRRVSRPRDDERGGMRIVSITRNSGMHKILTSGIIVLVALFLLISRVSPSVGGQGAPTAQSSPPLPRTSDGKPDLNGIWQVLTPAAWDIQDH